MVETTIQEEGDSEEEGGHLCGFLALPQGGFPAGSTPVRSLLDAWLWACSLELLCAR